MQNLRFCKITINILWVIMGCRLSTYNLRDGESMNFGQNFGISIGFVGLERLRFIAINYIASRESSSIMSNNLDRPYRDSKILWSCVF